MSADPTAPPEREDGRLLFCPFCRECYEGKTECPEHELPLVEFHRLPKQAHERELPGWDDPVVPWEWRFGRAWILLGALASLAGFFALPLAAGTYDGQPLSWTGFDVATGPAKNLWTVPFGAVMFIVFLYRRRTPREMRGAWLSGALVALLVGLSLAYSLWNVHRGVLRTHGGVAIEWSSGVWVMALGAVLLLIGSVRFGVMPRGNGADP